VLGGGFVPPRSLRFFLYSRDCRHSRFQWKTKQSDGRSLRRISDGPRYSYTPSLILFLVGSAAGSVH